MNHRRTIGAALCALLAASCTADAGRDLAGSDEPIAESQQSWVPVASDDDVIRFLEQASMGASMADYNDIVAHGGSAGYAGYTYWLGKQMNPALTPRSVYANTSDIRDQFFKFAINNPDQLRQRVALALAEIFVVSRVKLKTDDWMIPHLNTLSLGAFGNFKTLLKDVTESAAMGYYLDNANNYVASYDAATGLSSAASPNENFAREVMQLFTLGLCNLNTNGALTGGVCTTPYTQDNVESFAHAMSGWTYSTGVGSSCLALPGKKRSANVADPYQPMLACDITNGVQTDHDYAQQTLLSGYQTGLGAVAGPWKTRDAMEQVQDPGSMLSGALDNLFNHSNIAPFISKQLIQHLVTSNPSLSYVSRVANVFINDGTGVRGNLAAVITAILTDPTVTFIDARDPSPGTRFGRLREPALFVTGAVRLFGASTDGAGLRQQSAAMGQDIHYSPSVFNYFPPTFPLPGVPGDVGPEFGIEDTGTILARANFADAFVYNPTSLSATLSVNLAQIPGTNEGDFIEWIAAYGMHHKMPTHMRTTLTTALTPVAPVVLTLDQQKRRAIYLVLSSSQYQVSR